MVLKYLFDRIVSFIGLLFLWPVLLIVAILIKMKMPVDGIGSCIGEKINPPAGSKAGIRKLGYVRVAQRLDQALRGQNYKIFWI